MMRVRFRFRFRVRVRVRVSVRVRRDIPGSTLWDRHQQGKKLTLNDTHTVPRTDRHKTDRHQTDRQHAYGDRIGPWAYNTSDQNASSCHVGKRLA